MYRVHFDTGAGALCGTMRVLGWTTKAPGVTCPACRERLERAARAEGQSAKALPPRSQGAAPAQP